MTDTDSSPPQNEFTCLNTSAQSMFNYTPANNKKAAFIINEDGYISFPNQLWGFTFKVEIDQMELADPFYKNIKLDPVQSTIKADFTIKY